LDLLGAAERAAAEECHRSKAADLADRRCGGRVRVEHLLLGALMAIPATHPSALGRAILAARADAHPRAL
jgi:hypothetical protein